jgi:hypothetical protein
MPVFEILGHVHAIVLIENNRYRTNIREGGVVNLRTISENRSSSKIR